MKYAIRSLILVSLIAGCSPKAEEVDETAAVPELTVTPLCRPAGVGEANLNIGPIAFMPKHFTVSVLERRAKMDHLLIQFHGEAVREFQDVTALYVGKKMPLLVGETRLRFPFIPQMITNGEFVIDGKLHSGDIRALGERLAPPCDARAAEGG